MSGLLTAMVGASAISSAVALRRHLGPALALAVGLAASFLVVSAVGLVLLDLEQLRRPVVDVALAVGLTGQVFGASLLRRWWLARGAAEPAASEEGGVPWLLVVGLVLAVGLGMALRLDPSPYLHGGQDQGIYVNVGHHMARTGKLRPHDRLMAGEVAGIRQEDVLAAHRIEPVEPGSALEGVREGRWIAGIHVEDASEGRLVPGFFHLLPVWFALAEQDWGFSRSTWPLVPFWTASALALFGLVRRLALLGAPDEDACARRRASLAGLAGTLGLALHPLDLWISTFTVTENLARAVLLGAAWLALEADARARREAPGGVMLAVLAGLLFASGAFTRGSMVAHAVVLCGALMLQPGAPARSRWALQGALVFGVTLALLQGIWHSWPYFFSAASNHFHVPRIRPFQGVATAWTLGGAVMLLALDLGLGRLRRAERWHRRLELIARLGAVVLLLGAAAAAFAHAFGPEPEWGLSQQVVAVLWRHGGPVWLALGLVGVVAGVTRLDGRTLPWLVLGAAILMATALKPGIRYEFYYARYLVADAIPVLIVAAAMAWHGMALSADHWAGSKVAAIVRGVVLLAWIGPRLLLLDRPMYWTRDLEGGPEQLAEMFEPVPDGAVLFFDARAPGRWRGILAVPAALSFDKNVLVYPNNNFVERAIKAGTPVYFLSGGWEPDNRQYWPNPGQGPWRTEVVSRGVYRAMRAEVVEGDAPRRMKDWGGPWELHRIDRSIWRGSGAFTLYRGSSFVNEGPGALRTEPLEMTWANGARVELWLSGEVSGCDPVASLVEGASEVPLSALPPERRGQLLWAMPAAEVAAERAIHVDLRCDGAERVSWRWLSMRWER